MGTRRKRYTSSTHWKRVGGTLVVVLCVASATHLMASGSAAVSTDPLGYLDSCVLSGSTTVLYGWAHDPNANPGASPQVSVSISGIGTKTVNSDISGYRDSDVNEYLAKRNISSSSIYGFTATFTGVYKGGSYAPSGTVINVGAGASQAIPVNVTHSVLGRPYFVNGRLPDNCLATRPAPAPTPAPTPTPTPAPTPTPSPTPAPRPTTPSTPATPNAPAITPSTPTTPVAIAATSEPTSSVGATSGTLGTRLTIATANLRSVQAVWGTNKDALTSTTRDTDSTSNTATIDIAGLRAKTTYYYRLNRTALDGSVSTTAAASFKTAGYTLSATFSGVNNNGIAVTIPSLGLSETTDDKGRVAFRDISDGSYTLSYLVDGNAFEQTVKTTGTAETADTIIDVPVAIDLSRTAVSRPADDGNGLPIGIGLGIAILVAAFLVGVQLVRRRSAWPKASRRQAVTPTYQAPPQPPAAHTGESLKSMVIKSMQEEAARRRNQ